VTEHKGGAPEDERQGQAEDPDVPTGNANVHLYLVPDRTDTSAEPDTSVEMSAVNYDDVLGAVGRGAPTVLLGTSTRSLKRSLAKLMSLRQGESQSHAN
jgi:hypothetical protein